MSTVAKSGDLTYLLLKGVNVQNLQNIANLSFCKSSYFLSLLKKNV